MSDVTTVNQVRREVSDARKAARRGKARRKLVFYGVLVLVLIPFLFPFYYMISTSLKSPLEITAANFKWTFQPTLQNYAAIFRETDFVAYFFNSLIIATASTALGLLLGIPAAYAIARFRAPRLGLIILSSRVTPGITFLVPWFIIFNALGLKGTYVGLTLAHAAITMPLICWLMIGFFEEVPQELIDSALVDGATTPRTMWSIVLPVVKGGVASSAILAFIFSWNHFLFSIILSSNATRTLPVAVFDFMSYGQVNWGAIAAAATTMTFPVIILALLVQKQIVQGLAGGAVKG